MKRILALAVLVNLVFSIGTGFCASEPYVSVKVVYPVTITGKISDTTTAKPIANAEISLRVLHETKKVLSDKNGRYRIDIKTSFWFRLGTISASAKEYAQKSSLILILPDSRTIIKDFQLLDCKKPTLEIISPKSGEEIFTEPSIRINYSDLGSGAALKSITIYAQSKNVTKYIKIVEPQTALCVIPKNDPLAPGNCGIRAQIRDLAGNLAEQTISVKVVKKEDYFIALGKKAIAGRDALSAHSYFKQALDSNSSNREANFYFALIRLALLTQDNDVFAILKDMGFKGPGAASLSKEHLNLFNLQAVARGYR